MSIVQKTKDAARTHGIKTVILIFALFSAFYGFDTIYARAASVEKFQVKIEQRMDAQEVIIEERMDDQMVMIEDMLDSRAIEDLEDKILIINMKRNPTQGDLALKQRYDARLTSLRGQ